MNIKLISERSINRSLKLISRKGKNSSFPYKFDDNLIVSQPWKISNFIGLDIIANIYKDRLYKRLNIKNVINPYQEDILKVAKNFTEDSLKDIKSDNKNMSMIIKDRDIFKKYKYLLKYNSTQLYDMFKNTSECKFKINYPVRVYDKKTKKYKLSHYNNFDNDFENLFDISILDENKNKQGVHGLTYKICFNSSLSKLFIYNILTMNYDWLDYNIYSVKDITQLLYRKYIITNNRFNIEIDYDDFESVLGLNVNNITITKKYIEVGLKELQKLKLIQSWKFGNGGRRDLIYYELKKTRNKSI